MLDGHRKMLYVRGPTLNIQLVKKANNMKLLENSDPNKYLPRFVHFGLHN